MSASRRRSVAAALLALPSALLVVCLVWLAAVHGGGNLVSVAVHEDGRRTLADTVLYWRHFLREVPVAVLYATMAAGACAAYGPRRAPRPRGSLRWCAGAALLLVAIAFVGAAQTADARTALWDLLQAYVRDDDWAYGSHWRAHALSTLAFPLTAVVAAAGLGWCVDGSFPRPRPDARRRWLGGSLAAFAALSALCLPELDFIRDPRMIGHEAREAVTHLLITLPLALGIWLLVNRAATAPAPGTARPPAEVVAAAIAAGVLVSGLGIATLATGATQVARPGAGLSSLVAAHVFEHTLDYVFVALLTAFCAARQ